MAISLANFKGPLSMRFSATLLSLALSSAFVSATLASAQTGFSTQTYPAVLPANSDNTRLLAADLNGDGRPDLFTYGSRSGASTASGNVFLNNGSGGFLAPVALPGTGLLSAAAIGDMNGDGYPDIVGCMNLNVGTQEQQISITVYLNNGSGTFKALPAITDQGQCNAMTLGDINRDGKPDIITVGYLPGQYNPSGQFFPGYTSSLNTFQNNGDGTVGTYGGTVGSEFDDSASGSQYSNCGPIGIAGADFLQDGNFDLVVTTSCLPLNSAGTAVTSPTNYAGTVFFLPPSSDQFGNYSYSTFTHVLSTPEIYSNAKVADLNGDGKPDAVFDGASTATTGDLIELLNTGNGTFASSKLQTASIFYGAGIADFNGDGYPDIASSYTTASGNTYPPSIEILNGSKTGTFTDSQSFSTGASTTLAGDITTADFNGDGKPDFATLVYSSSAKTTSLNIYTNTQAGSGEPCTAPTAANTNTICTPTPGQTLNSPITVTAASNVSGFTLNRLYLDNNSVYQVASQTVSTSITAAVGTHNLVLVSYNSAGKAVTSSVNFTVGAVGPTGGCLPTSAGLMICSPTSLSTEGSPVYFSAGAIAKAGNLTAIRAYIDYNELFTSFNPSPTKTYDFTQEFAVPVGQHLLVMVGYDSTGGSVTNSLNFTVTGTCTAPTGGTSIKICSPGSLEGTQNSPFAVTAGAYTATGYIAAIRVYIDNVAVATYNNPGTTKAFSVNQSVSTTSGSHNLVVVAYPSTGGAVTSSETISVF